MPCVFLSLSLLEVFCGTGTLRGWARIEGAVGGRVQGSGSIEINQVSECLNHAGKEHTVASVNLLRWSSPQPSQRFSHMSLLRARRRI